MAGDLEITERAVLDAAGDTGLTLHHYGRVSIVAVPEAVPGSASAWRAPSPLPPDTAGLSEVEHLGLQALQLRESAGYRQAKEKRPRQGEPWDMPGCLVEPPVVPGAGARALSRAVPPPTSDYLEGSVAVGIVIVQGPTPDLKFSEAESLKTVAEVQNGLSYLAAANPLAEISFSYDIQNVTLSTPADPNAPDLEAHWRDPAMRALGYAADFSGVYEYVEDLRGRFGTRWTFCAYFTKYPLWHFGYASIGGPRLVMDYNNDGWGPDNIDRVFAHETGHIFGAPDEYAFSGCDCEGSWGRFGIANHNCENCASFGGALCLMKANDFTMCGFTPAHLGWAPRLVLKSFGYGAGGWRVERHPRMLADTTGNGVLDIVGFADSGVMVAQGRGDGRFGTPTQVCTDFGYSSGWRVEKHPRFAVDTTGDGRADIVGFGQRGVSVSRAKSDGTFDAVKLVSSSFGYQEGWRVERHPRFAVDLTGDGRADLIGFGDAGVSVSLARTDGSYPPARLVLRNFGYAQGWRVERHPRMLADTSGDGLLDIVGFGDGGVWIARGRGGGEFHAPRLMISEFGYSAGGWRMERHLRTAVDLTGDGRADIVGFAESGVYVAAARTDGTFGPVGVAVDGFGFGGGWRVDQHPRFLADTTGDGLLDVVGFGSGGIWVARALGNGSFEPPGLTITKYGETDGWRMDRHLRIVADLNGDGKADILGFAQAGISVLAARPVTGHRAPSSPAHPHPARPAKGSAEHRPDEARDHLGRPHPELAL